MTPLMPLPSSPSLNFSFQLLMHQINLFLVQIPKANLLFEIAEFKKKIPHTHYSWEWQFMHLWELNLNSLISLNHCSFSTPLMWETKWSLFDLSIITNIYISSPIEDLLFGKLCSHSNQYKKQFFQGQIFYYTWMYMQKIINK